MISWATIRYFLTLSFALICTLSICSCVLYSEGIPMPISSILPSSRLVCKFAERVPIVAKHKLSWLCAPWSALMLGLSGFEQFCWLSLRLLVFMRFGSMSSASGWRSKSELRDQNPKITNIWFPLWTVPCFPNLSDSRLNINTCMVWVRESWLN